MPRSRRSSGLNKHQASTVVLFVSLILMGVGFVLVGSSVAGITFSGVSPWNHEVIILSSGSGVPSNGGTDGAIMSAVNAITVGYDSRGGWVGFDVSGTHSLLQDFHSNDTGLVYAAAIMNALKAINLFKSMTLDGSTFPTPTTTTASTTATSSSVNVNPQTQAATSSVTSASMTSSAISVTTTATSTQITTSMSVVTSTQGSVTSVITQSSVVTSIVTQTTTMTSNPSTSGFLFGNQISQAVTGVIVSIIGIGLALASRRF